MDRGGGESLQSSLDFKEMVEISQHDKGGKVDAARFTITMPEKTFKFRASSAAEGEEWFNVLCEWREYLILQ